MKVVKFGELQKMMNAGFNLSRFQRSWTWRYTSLRSYSFNKTIPFNHSNSTSSADSYTETLVSKVISSGVSVLQSHGVYLPQLRIISRELMKRRRYEPALEILNWMEAQHSSELFPADYAMKQELIVKQHSCTEAEKYFESLTSTVSMKAASLSLLRCYVAERSTNMAEAFMLKMNKLGLALSAHPFNEMMKLYMATSQYQKVQSVVLQMKRNRIPLNILSYNLLMGACGELSQVAFAETVYNEMLADQNIQVGWSSLFTLATVYMKAGLAEKAILALKTAENKISKKSRRPYFFLITQYASLKNKDGVLRVWEASKAVKSRMTCADYMCILSSLVKLGDVREAERIFVEWESQCRTYDIRVSNILLGAYMRNGSAEKAESLHHHTLEKGGCPNSKTSEILVEGWIRNQQMDKAINAVKRGLASL